MSVSSSNSTELTCTPRDLSPAQSQAATLMGLGHRQREVARLLDVANETVCRWQRIPAFKLAVCEAQRELIETIRARHIFVVGKAMDELGELLAHPSPVIKL